MLTIRPSTADDKDQIWEILQATIKGGDAFTYSPNTAEDEMLDYWFAKGKRTYTAVMDNAIVGTFFIQDNQPGLGSHVANAGYCTSPKFYGRGIGKEMGQFSLVEARKLGYKAMQFNIVVKTNTTAVRLWQEIGFQIIGEIPDAFQHQKLGLVDAYIMYQKL
jgi:L-amino acid N-acyltransferase YncA